MENKPRRPWIALLLSLLAPGLGQLYNGQLKKGLVFYFVAFFLSTILLLTRLPYSFYGMLIFLSLLLALVLIIAGEAFVNARKLKDITLKPYNRWYYYILIVVLSFGINTAVEGFMEKDLIDPKAYKIPSGNMEPTILIGDRIIVDLNSYTQNNPQREDIVVFQYPEDPSKDFIKRIIGIGGDQIEIRNKKIFLNGLPYNDIHGVYRDDFIIPGPRDNFGPVTVPKDSYFVMGDNRDNSNDSRFLGFVDRNQIRGKALYFYWSWDKEEFSVRWNRIGKEIK